MVGRPWRRHGYGATVAPPRSRSPRFACAADEDVAGLPTDLGADLDFWYGKAQALFDNTIDIKRTA